MAKRPTLIPLRQRVDEISRYYKSMEQAIMKELMKVNVGSYAELKAMSVQAETNRIIERLNKFAVRWAKRSIKEAYGESKSIAGVSLDILGAKKSPDWDDRIHDLTIKKYVETTIEDLYKANSSIRNNVNIYLYLANRATQGITQIQEFGIDDEIAIEAIIARAIDRGEKPGYAIGLIRDYFQDKIGDGQFIQINGRNYNLKYYSRLVARTRMREAQTKAVKNMCQQHGNDLVQVSEHNTDCQICLPYEGQIYSLSGRHPTYPLLTDTPPWHPNCILPGQRCISPGGFVAGIGARYNGEAIKLTFAETGDLTVTINHLLLTPYGFIPAYLLREGDDVFYCPDFKRIITGHPYNNGMPSLIEEIIDSLAETPGMTTSIMPMSPEYIHGDGRFCDGNISIINPNSFLGNTTESIFFKKNQTFSFNSGYPNSSLFPGEGNFMAMLKALAFTADSIMGGLRAPSPFFLARSSGRDTTNFTKTTKRTSNLSKSSMNSLVRNSEFLSKIAFKSSGLIQTQKLVGIDKFSFHGYIYDLHTPTSLYLANGVLSSNCEHNILPTSEEAITFRGQYG